jgi:hypothetical protein
MDKLLRNAIIISLLLVSVSVAFYFVYFLPSKQQKLETVRRECAIEATNKARDKYKQGIEAKTDLHWKTISEGQAPQTSQGFYDTDFDTFFNRCLQIKGVRN